jgi:two-component system sensor histidine kinase/response regulator
MSDERSKIMTGQSDSHKGNIIIIDDTLPNLRILATILTANGYLVRGISSGAMALAAAASEPPDVILLDIMMPEMDGYEVCRQLKANEQTREIPVIFMSALDEIMDKVKAFSVGGVDYITKPFQMEEVLARVETHIALQALQKKLEHQVLTLQDLNTALQESNSELDAFAHTVAHDLKNPVANILMSTELLQEIAGDPHQDQDKTAEIVRWLNVSGRKVVNIIDELLLLASVRQEDVTRTPVDMARVVRQAQNRLDWMIAQYQGAITLPEQWPVALGYAPWIEEIWVNYLSNGLKYGGQPPQLQLGATKLSDGTIRFWIKDNGPGIPPEKVETLFTEFTRIERTRAEGHGLGLSIVKRIANKLNGSVGVESQIGQGSLFYFTLPCST